MRCLLSADLFRLRKNRVFLLCWAGMVLFGLFLVAEEHLEPYPVALDRVVFLPLSLYGLVAGAFAGMFLGQEYAEGTIRNKLVAGHGRPQVYLSGALTVAVGALVLYVSAIAVTAAVGCLLFPTSKPVSEFLLSGLLGVLSCLSYVAVYCLIVMLCRGRSARARR